MDLSFKKKPLLHICPTNVYLSFKFRALQQNQGLGKVKYYFEKIQLTVSHKHIWIGNFMVHSCATESINWRISSSFSNTKQDTIFQASTGK